jgi:superfamily II DNA or RNA helicase
VDVTAADATSRTFFSPFDLIRATAHRRPRRLRRQHQRALEAVTRAWAEHADVPLAALLARIDLLPYQLEPWLAIRHGHHRRVLIADDVGLGKTIEAGLILAELARRRDAPRALVIAPSHLCGQWQQELLARLGLRAHIADAASLATLTSELPRETNPWSLERLWIAPLDYVKQAHVLESLPPDPWDVVVIDEAHMVTGQSDRRHAVAHLAARSRRVILLTATPRNGIDDGRALTAIGALDRRGDCDTNTDEIVVFRRRRSDLGVGRSRRVRRVRVRPTDAEEQALDLLDQFARAASAQATSTTADATRLLVSVLTKRALSTSTALALSVERRLAFLDGIHTIVPDVVQGAFDFGDDDDAALCGVIGLSVERERSWMRRLRAAAWRAARSSRKLSTLARLLRRADEPAIVFTEFRDSLNAAVAALTPALRVAIAHGALDARELQAALAQFTTGDAQVLVATDVASQGLNLHHRSRWVIHLDLPWNPIRLEQRAGRVDRLGQVRDIHVTELTMAHRWDERFRARLGGREAAAHDERALPGDTRWRRRARAVARVLARRRLCAARWRGRCRCTARAPEARVPRAHGGREVAARARRAREFRHERALRARRRRRARGRAAVLPGAQAAADERRSARRAQAFESAIRAIDARIAALEAEHRRRDEEA